MNNTIGLEFGWVAYVWIWSMLERVWMSTRINLKRIDRLTGVYSWMMSIKCSLHIPTSTTYWEKLQQWVSASSDETTICVQKKDDEECLTDMLIPIWIVAAIIYSGFLEKMARREMNMKSSSTLFLHSACSSASYAMLTPKAHYSDWHRSPTFFVKMFLASCWLLHPLTGTAGPVDNSFEQSESCILDSALLLQVLSAIPLQTSASAFSINPVSHHTVLRFDDNSPSLLFDCSATQVDQNVCLLKGQNC